MLRKAIAWSFLLNAVGVVMTTPTHLIYFVEPEYAYIRKL